LAGAEGDKEDEEPVEDMLDDMDFEEISDGELDAEDIKAGNKIHGNVTKFTKRFI